MMRSTADSAKHPSVSAPGGVPPVAIWAALGAAIMALIVFVLARWIGGPNFHPVVPSGPAPPGLMKWIWLLQILSPITLLVFLWFYVLRPWRSVGHMTLDGMLLLSWLSVYFHNALMNYLTSQLLWSSFFINYGSWGPGSFPTWFSPGVVPEPFIGIGATYGTLGFWPALGVCGAMGWLQRRCPKMSTLELILCGWLVAIFFNTASEVPLLWTGIYAYPGAIRGLAIFPGRTYQFPMSSAICFGAVFVATATLRFFTDADGHSWVERGAGYVAKSLRMQTLLRFLAVFGFVQVSMFVLFTIPIQWVGLMSDPWPALPAHLTNGVCSYGPAGRGMSRSRHSCVPTPN
jgi:hypothetical protein